MFADSYRRKNIRTYGLTRASNAGAAPLPFVIYNDYYSHEDFITALVNSGKFLLYDDDGESYDYESGAYSWTELSVITMTDGTLQGQLKRLDKNIFNYGKMEWIFMSKTK